MKKSYLLIIPIFLSALIVIIVGCEYDVAEPHWDQPPKNWLETEITRVEPLGGAPAGVNYINIFGKDFAKENNKVYFNNIKSEILDNTDSSITVYRPNIVCDTTIINVVTDSALTVAKYGPYPIDPVMEFYGSFIEDVQLRDLVVDDNENLYVIQQSPLSVYKISPEGVKEVLGEIASLTYDIQIAPDGKLVLISNKKIITKMDIATGVESDWAEVTKNVRYGCFDDYGNFYTSGRNSGLFIVVAGNTIGELVDDLYAKDEIMCMEVYDGSLYLLVGLRNPDADNPELAIWRHEILDDTGNLSDRELVLNWVDTGELADADPTGFTFSKEGIIYVGSEADYPILLFNPNTGSQDILYRKILPSWSVSLTCGTSHYLYMILGSSADDNHEWNVLRIDIGE